MTEKNVPVKDTKLRFVKRFAFLVLDRATRPCKRFYVMNTTAQGEQMNLLTSIRNIFSVKANNIYSFSCPWCNYTTTSPSFDMYDSGCCDKCGEYYYEHPSELEAIEFYESQFPELENDNGVPF
jgi:hypothetical protein